MSDSELDTSKFLTIDFVLAKYIPCPVCKSRALVLGVETEVQEPVRGHWKKGQGFIQTNIPAPAKMSLSITCFDCGTETEIKGSREVIEDFLNKNLIK